MEILAILVGVFLFGYASGYRRGRGNVVRATESVAEAFLGRRR